jgi:hypothetical protein
MLRPSSSRPPHQPASPEQPPPNLQGPAHSAEHQLPPPRGHAWHRGRAGASSGISLTRGGTARRHGRAAHRRASWPALRQHPPGQDARLRARHPRGHAAGRWAAGQGRHAMQAAAHQGPPGAAQRALGAGPALVAPTAAAFRIDHVGRGCGHDRSRSLQAPSLLTDSGSRQHPKEPARPSRPRMRRDALCVCACLPLQRPSC